MPEPANKRTLTDAELIQVAAMAARGLRNEDVARRLGMGRRTWFEIKERDERVRKAFEAGRSELHEELVSKLIAKARNGEVAPILFALKSMFGYSEQRPMVEHRHSVRLELPRALTPEQYEQTKALPTPTVEITPGEVREMEKEK